MSVYRTIGPTLVYFVVAMRDQVQDMRDIPSWHMSTANNIWKFNWNIRLTVSRATLIFQKRVPDAVD